MRSESYIRHWSARSILQHMHRRVVVHKTGAEALLEAAKAPAAPAVDLLDVGAEVAQVFS